MNEILANAHIKELLTYGALYLVLLLSAFGCTPAPVIEKPVEVKVPVTVSCVSQVPPEPVWRAPLMKYGSHADQVKAMAQDFDAAHGYIGVLQAIIGACK